MGNLPRTSALLPGAVTDRCVSMMWGDARGHSARGEHWCAVCVAKGRGRQAFARLRAGRSTRLARADLARLVVLFNRHYRPDGFDEALDAALVEVLTRG